MKKTIYDVVVVGGGTAGCAAAYAAGKKGLSVLLIEKNIHLGGTMSSALVTPAMYSCENQINTDFFEALIKEMRKLKGQTTYLNNPGWFNPEILKLALDRLMAKSKVEVHFDSRVIGVNIVGKEINGITISSNLLSVYIGAKYIVDSTGNCDIGCLSGCEFLDSKNNFQPISLRFEMAGINLEEFSDWLLHFDKDRNVSSANYQDGQMHLSTAYTWDKGAKWALEPLFQDAVDKNILKATDCNYFQVFTIPGMPSSLSFNCPRIISTPEIDPLDTNMASKALVEARESIFRLANFCKIYLPGFKHSYVSNIADALGVRVSRRIKGKYVYTYDDLVSGKKFENPVLISNYPVDVHSSKKNKSILQKTEQEYQLPLESLISANFDNLFVAGRCLSADFKAQAALRIQPSCFSMGEGVGKYIAKLVD